jgi:hypothetical protein
VANDCFFPHRFLFPLAPTMELRADFSVTFIIFTDVRTPWTGDQLVARPLPKHRATQTQNKHIHIPNIHGLCGFRTHDPGFRVSEDSTCLRPLGYRDRLFFLPLLLLFSPLVLQPRFGPWPTSMKLSVSLRFTRSETFGRTPWADDELVTRPLPVHKHRGTHIHTYIP